MKTTLITMAAITVFATPALATGKGGGGNSFFYPSANSSATGVGIATANNRNSNSNRNTNLNTNVATANNHNLNAQGQIQGQHQGQSQSANNNNVINTNDTINIEGSASAPGFGANQCAISASGAVAGGTVASGGISIPLRSCNIRAEADVIERLGGNGLAHLCMINRVRRSQGALCGGSTAVLSDQDVYQPGKAGTLSTRSTSTRLHVSGNRRNDN